MKRSLTLLAALALSACSAGIAPNAAAVPKRAAQTVAHSQGLVAVQNVTGHCVSLRAGVTRTLDTSVDQRGHVHTYLDVEVPECSFGAPIPLAKRTAA